jgi:hypothetical protein
LLCGALGSPYKNSHNIFYQTLNPRVCLPLTFSHSFLYERYVRKHIETGLKILNVSTEKLMTIFTQLSPGISVAWNSLAWAL